MKAKKTEQNQDVLFGAHDLGVRFGDVTVLENLTFSVARGEFVGLIGPNGAGKTTLLKTLLGLVTPTHGRLERRRDIVVRYVPQQYVLPSHVPISVAEVVAMGATGRTSEAEIVAALARVGLDASYSTRTFHALSGGQKQRVVIARAIVVMPDVIFFDEPLSGVDLTTKMHIYEILRAFHRDGMTIFFVSHDVDHVIDACDRVLCLDRELHRGCHPIAFARGKRDGIALDVVECLVDDAVRADGRQIVHHHH